MSELRPLPSERQFVLNPTQAGTMGVMMVAITAMAFFVGFSMGRDRGRQARPQPAGLISPDLRSDDITELLARVEQAAARERTAQADAGDPPPEDLRYPSLLTEDPVVAAPPEVAPEPAGEVEVEPEAAPVVVPESGWAVQVASYPDPEQATARAAELGQEGLQAWTTQALVAGSTWYRVRVGPYDTREAADRALGPLGRRLGQSDLLVTRAR